MICFLGFLCKNESSVNLVDGLVGVGLGFRASIVDIFPHKITLFDFLVFGYGFPTNLPYSCATLTLTEFYYGHARAYPPHVMQR